MIDKLKIILLKRKHNIEYRIALSAVISLCITCFFAIYNGFLGITSGSRWHGGICGFYLCLVFLRYVILLWRNSQIKKSPTVESISENPPHDTALTPAGIAPPSNLVFWGMWSALLIVDISLIYPISMMVLMEKPVKIGLTAAIIMAAYTFYKLGVLCFSMVAYRRTGKKDIFTYILRTINFIEGAVSVLSIQNTLIMVNSVKTPPMEMIFLSEIVGGVIYILILSATARLPKKYKQIKATYSND